VPPPNPGRRDHLADAAIEVLARDGSRGLTHRAVDVAAATPPGTTSRYFRTREALLNGVVDRMRQRLAELVDAHVVAPLDPSRLEDTLVGVLTAMVTDERSQPLALFELHLESSRNPRLRQVLADATTARRDLIVRQCHAAGVDVSREDAMLLEMTVMGILVTAVTTAPEVFDDLEGLVRRSVRSLVERYRPDG
jgi:DNA-binding transcriptional regulator YbjK